MRALGLATMDRVSPAGQESGAPAAAAAPAVSVVIPHLNDEDNLDRCLTLLRQQTFPQPFEIIVVDNGSRGGFEAVCALVGTRAKAINADRKGAGPARNAGVAASRGAILAFIDSDCRPDPDWLAEGVIGLASHDIVGGTVRVDVEDPDDMKPTEAFEVVFAFRNAMYVRSKGFTVTASMFVHRRVFDAVGPFRVGVSEDVDWCHRAGKRGYRLGFVPNSVVGHPARTTWDELKRKSDRLSAETYALYCEMPWGQVRWLVRAWLGPASIIPHLVHVLITGKLATMRDRRNAARVLVRIRLARFVAANRLVFERWTSPAE
jgi:glycosyltransferase involved in cell wall biosynthesis